MKNYIYEAISIRYSIWTGRAKQDYLEIINEKGKDGWRFVGFLPYNLKPRGVKGQELIFEKEMGQETI